MPGISNSLYYNFTCEDSPRYTDSRWKEFLHLSTLPLLCAFRPELDLIYNWKYTYALVRLVSILIFNTTYGIWHFTGDAEEILYSCIKPVGRFYPKVALEKNTFSSSIWNYSSQMTPPFLYGGWSLTPEIEIWVLLVVKIHHVCMDLLAVRKALFFCGWPPCTEW